MAAISCSGTLKGEDRCGLQQQLRCALPCVGHRTRVRRRPWGPGSSLARLQAGRVGIRQPRRLRGAGGAARRDSCAMRGWRPWSTKSAPASGIGGAGPPVEEAPGGGGGPPVVEAVVGGGGVRAACTSGRAPTQERGGEGEQQGERRMSGVRVPAAVAGREGPGVAPRVGQSEQLS